MSVVVGELEIVTAPPAAATADPGRPEPLMPSPSARDAELERALDRQAARAARLHAD